MDSFATASSLIVKIYHQLLINLQLHAIFMLIQALGTIVNRMMHVLVVEDEMLLVLFVEDVLSSKGLEVSKAATVDQAISILANEHIDAVLVGLNFSGQQGEQLAGVLEERRMPVLLAAEWSAQGLPEYFAALPKLENAYDPLELLSAVSALMPTVDFKASSYYARCDFLMATPGE